jgi:hypothetical protein
VSTEETAESAPAAHARKHRPRRIIAAILAVIVGLVMTISVTGSWLKQTTFNTSRWVATVGPLPSDPKVQAALGAYATDQLFSVVNVDHYFSELLPKRAQVLAGPLEGAVHDFVQREVTSFLGTEQFQKLWIEANRTLHERALAVLQGKSKALDEQNGKVVLDLIPVLVAVLNLIDQKTNGALSSHVPQVNEIQNLTAADARQRLSEALNRPICSATVTSSCIPATFGTIALFDQKQLSVIQKAVQYFQRGVWAFWVLTVILIGAALLIAPDRRRIAIWLGLSVAGWIVAFRSVARAAGKNILDGIVLPSNREAAQDVVHQVLATYRTLTAIVIAIALVVALTAFLAGPSHLAARVRHVFTRQSWLSEHKTAAMIVVLLAAIAALLIVNLTFSGLLLILVVAGILEIVLWRLPEPPPAPEVAQAA